MDPFKLVITYCINLTALIALMRKNTTLFTHRKLLIPWCSCIQGIANVCTSLVSCLIPAQINLKLRVKVSSKRESILTLVAHVKSKKYLSVLLGEE